MLEDAYVRLDKFFLMGVKDEVDDEVVCVYVSMCVKGYVGLLIKVS